ncbi:hypothetical protein PM082_012662 [Marasmius tenuissimus]|nr:hypothetical protein PM082_012662 [Marasmius tenuissimus]
MDDSIPLHTDLLQFVQTTKIKNVGDFHWQKRCLTRDVNVNTERGRLAGDIFWHGDKIWIYQGDEKETKWVTCKVAFETLIKCPIREMDEYTLNPYAKSWRKSDKWRWDKSVKRQKITGDGPSKESAAVIDVSEPPPHTSISMASASETTPRSPDLTLTEAIPSSQHPAMFNSWIIDLLKAMDSPPRPPPSLLSRVQHIFEFIRGHTEHIPFYHHQLDGTGPQNVQFTLPLETVTSFSLEMVFTDLIENYTAGLDINIINSEEGYDDRDSSVMEFLSSLSFSDGTGNFEGRSLACLNVFSTPKGTGEMKIKWGSHIGEKSKVLHPGEASTSITPYGHVTSPHTDPFPASIVVHHFQGRKLWFTWPPTKENLTLFRIQGADHTYRDLPLWIRQLKGLEVILMETTGSTFMMRPFTIHACISLSKSCHITQPMIHRACFKDVRTATEVMISQNVGKMHGSVVAHFSAFLGVFYRYGKKEWVSFMRKNEDKVEVERWVNDVEKWHKKNVKKVRADK